jgi:hypothetical protein
LPVADDLCALLRGLDRAHGSYEPRGTDAKGKVNGIASTQPGPLTPALWEGHLAGRRGVGLPPLLDDGTCVWGAIDIDVYDLDLPALVKVVHGLGLPLVVCRTKSGGAHLYLFLSEPVKATLVRPKLAAWAVALKHPGVEVFPKQDRLLWRVVRKTTNGPVEAGGYPDRVAAEAKATELRTADPAMTVAIERDTGNWLNAPYYGGDLSTRYALGADGVALTPAEFVAYARSKVISRAELVELDAELPAEDVRLPGAPPCLVTLAASGFGSGMRNNALYQLAIYANKANPEGWQERVMAYNRQFLDPPLSDSEARTIVKSVGRKEYQYRCSQPPFKGVCDKPACLKSDYGVGGATRMSEEFEYGTFTKVMTKPPLWLLEVNGVQVEFTALEDVTTQRRFAHLVGAAVWPPKVPPTMKGGPWRHFWEGLLARCEMEEVPSDATPEGQLSGHLTRFCTGRAQAKTVDELLLGKPFTEAGRVFFIAADFLAYLQQQRINGITERKLYAWLRDRQLQSKAMVLKGRQVEVWDVPAPEAQSVEFEVPRVEGAATDTDDDDEHRYEF